MIKRWVSWTEVKIVGSGQESSSLTVVAGSTLYAERS